MRALGIVAGLFYRLSRQRCLGLPLDVVAVLLAPAAALYSVARLLRGGRWPLSPPWLILLGLCSLAALAMRLRRFVLFRPYGAGQLTAPRRAELAPFQPLPVRASGWFEVHGERRYYVQAAGKLEATELGERVLMVQVSPVSLLGLFSSAEEEWGWWYDFFRPEEIGGVIAGDLYFGWRSHPALRLEFGPARPPAYLAFDHAAHRDLVQADLSPGSLVQCQETSSGMAARR